MKKVAAELGEDLTEDEINHIFSKADLDEDGFVTADDFYNIMTHKVYWEQWFEIIYLSILINIQPKNHFNLYTILISLLI